MTTLFDVEEDPERDAFLRRVEALVAPVAANSGAVVDDAGLLEVARAVYEAFGDREASGGLTRAQSAAACSGVCDEAAFQSRFDLFCRLGMLQPHFDKSHQQRYVFNPTSAAGLLVFERLGEHGGVDEQRAVARVLRQPILNRRADHHRRRPLTRRPQHRAPHHPRHAPKWPRSGST